MIRKLQPDEIDRAVEIWLRASIDAHSFIDREVWESGAEDMREEYLPSAENWALDHDGEVVGFFSLEGNMLAALFVDPEVQGRGFGKKLLDKAKSLHSRLVVSVYEENDRAVSFYRRHGFACADRRKDLHTEHMEWVMEWEAGQE
ncbi:N-acetyltransferase [Persicimonas caeni]|uniref:N-acetyltransferase n=1 Tax=Persicimonas caeni TaxID=2292766 RepID=A0A4Y6PZZ9_PERCE|nr:N-acetyltransferase [Persicimonas caeni]QDG53918.1 N-acetyltransferase [Persicimonas caeni]QED35139.1 N-acetyltransferase [Persicimonas caeni]